MSTAEDTQATFVWVTGELAELAATGLGQRPSGCASVAETMRRRRGRLVRAVNDLTELLTAARKLVAQPGNASPVSPPRKLRGRSALLARLDRLRTKGFWLAEDDVFGCDEHVCALSVMGARREGRCANHES